MKPDIIYSDGDWPQVIQRGDISIGDTVLVDTSCYNIPGYHWCEVVHLSDGDASPYPIKVELPRYGRGQYSRAQVNGVMKTKQVIEKLKTVNAESPHPPQAFRYE